MKKITGKMTKILMLISMIFSTLQTPIQVFASVVNSDTTNTTPVGAIKLGENGEISESGSVSTEAFSESNDVSVKKTVTAIDASNGKYRVNFEIKGKEDTTERPVYVVIVFDKSGSMNDKGRNERKWTQAVKGAQDFTNALINNKTGLKNSKVALVTFAKSASKARGFEHAGLASSLFGRPNGGTNLHDGLVKAQEYLSDIPEEDKDTALKYVVVMSDGKPTYYNGGGNGSDTTKSILNATLNEAKSIKDSGTTILSVGYGVKNDGVAIWGDYNYNNVTYKNITTKEILQLVASSKDNYYGANNEDEIVNIFKGLANEIITPGKNATLIDNIGGKFKLVTNVSNNGSYDEENNAYQGEVIEKITKDAINYTFDIEIDPDAETGWHQTNAGFKLVYTDNNGNEQTINSSEDPYVYWKQREYKYIVNYYKDSISANNKIASDERYAPNGTVINVENVEKDKYLFGRYEFDSIDPISITITNNNDDGKIEEINVLYTAKGMVTARYKDTKGIVLAQEESTTGIVGKDYTTNSKDIYGYTLVSEPENKNGVYIYNENNEPIYVDYIYTKNEGSLEINDVVKTQINKILGANSTFKYVLSYNGKLDNYVGKANLTLVDTLPYEVESIEYDENVCSYDAATRKLTCNKEVEITKDNMSNILNTEIIVIVKYKGLTSTVDLAVKNIVDSKLVYGDKAATSDASVTDTVKASVVTAIYVDEDDKELADSETTRGLIDNKYTTNEKTIYGYTLKEIPENKDGVYTEEEILVKYVYTKNAGKTTENEVVKVGPENINSVDGVFNYTLTYNGKIEDYVGKAKLTLVDYLPYEIDTDKSSYDKACVYDGNKTITCVMEKEITEGDKEVKANFELSLVFKNVDSDKVTNIVKSSLNYGKTPDEDEDKTETEVFKGTVIATYEDEDGNTLAKQEEMKGLAGSEYDTRAKTIYGYTLKEVPSNKNGKYIAKEVIKVEYVYVKNDGTTVKNEVTKTQINKILGADSTFKYVLAYDGEIKDYVGEARVILKDTLPYEVASIKYDENSCSYDASTRELTCVKIFGVTKENTKIKATFSAEVRYNNLTSEVDLGIKNIVNSTLIYGNNQDEDDASVIDTVKSSVVTAIYVDEDDKELADSETTRGLIDNKYTTNEKTIYGYTLKEIPENKDGVYTEEEILVKYVYTKNAGKTTENEVVKVGPENINSVDGVFNYTLTYNGKIEDYVGKAKLTLVDYLPYEIDTDKSSYDKACVYDGNKTITCVMEKEITEGDKEVKANFELSLVFKNVDSDKVTNIVKSSLNYGKTPDEDEDKTETEVFKGTVIATYEDEDGNTLAKQEEMKGLAGSEYKTNEKDILGYTLKEVDGNENGKYIAKEVIKVRYIYSKNAGNSEESLVKKGLETVTSVKDAFEYTITYKAMIKDYVGDVKVTLIDELPYEIDLDKSVINTNSDDVVCKYENGLLVCEYSKNIETADDSVIDIAIDLKLYFINVDSEIVINKVKSMLIYGDKEEVNEDSTGTKVLSGKVIINYVTDKGEKLADTMEITGLVGTSYETEKRSFKNYFFKEVIGNETGLYQEEDTEVTYVYSLIPLPPQTGVEVNNPLNMNYLGVLIFGLVILLIRKRVY